MKTRHFVEDHHEGERTYLFEEAAGEDFREVEVILEDGDNWEVL